MRKFSCWISNNALLYFEHVTLQFFFIETLPCVIFRWLLKNVEKCICTHVHVFTVVSRAGEGVQPLHLVKFFFLQNIVISYYFEITILLNELLKCHYGCKKPLFLHGSAPCAEYRNYYSFSLWKLSPRGKTQVSTIEKFCKQFNL